MIVSQESLAWLETLFSCSEAPLFLIGSDGSIIRRNKQGTPFTFPLPIHPEKPLCVAPWGFLQIFPWGDDWLLIGSADDQRKQQGAFLSFTTHQLRTPLSIIQSWSELLEKNFLTSDTERTEAYRILFSESQRLSGMLSKMLNFYRFATGIHVPDIQDISIGQIIQKVVDAQRDFLNSRKVTLFVENDNPACLVRTDLHILTNILGILLENAGQCSEENQEITLSIQEDNKLICISVQDFAKGIPPEALPVVLEPFRIPERSTLNTGNLGLGLPTAKLMADAIQAKLEIQSDSSGSCIKIWVERTSQTQN